MKSFIDENAPSPIDGPVQKITGAGVGNVVPSPLEAQEEQAGPEEQAAYEDLIKRAVALIHDTRGPQPISDAIVKALSSDEAPAYVVIGKQAGTIMRLLYENAKRQKVKYPPSVLQAVGLDVVTELTNLAREVGAVPDLPEPGSPEEVQFDEMAVLEATKEFGQYMLDTGQADPAEYQQVMSEQMHREATGGELDDWNMEQMPDMALQEGVAQTRGFANG